MDYALELQRGILKAKEEANQQLLEAMDMEANYLLSCLEQLSILEGYEVVTEAKNSKSFLQRLQEFFKSLIESFTNKVARLTERDLKWLHENEKKLKSMDCKGFSIEVIPYWKGPDIEAETKRLLDNLYRDLGKLKGKTNVKVSELLFDSPDFIKKHIDPLKNRLRAGVITEPKPVTISDSSLKSLVPKFIDYCMNYRTNVVPFVKNQIKNIDREIKTVEREIKAVKESTILVEGAVLKDTELRYCVGFSQLLEAETTSPTKVTVTKPEKKEDNTETSKEEPNVYEGKSKQTLTYVNKALTLIKRILTTAMTVLEEKYTVYMKILRSLAGSSVDEKPNSVEDSKKLAKK